MRLKSTCPAFRICLHRPPTLTDSVVAKLWIGCALAGALSNTGVGPKKPPTHGRGQRAINARRALLKRTLANTVGLKNPRLLGRGLNKAERRYLSDPTVRGQMKPGHLVRRRSVAALAPRKGGRLGEDL